MFVRVYEFSLKIHVCTKTVVARHPLPPIMPSPCFHYPPFPPMALIVYDVVTLKPHAIFHLNALTQM